MFSCRRIQLEYRCDNNLNLLQYETIISKFGLNYNFIYIGNYHVGVIIQPNMTLLMIKKIYLLIYVNASRMKCLRNIVINNL